MLKKKTILLLLASLFVWSRLAAQQNAASPYTPSVIPPSPNEAALMKFTDIPVSPYTGTADITVPIYTIQAKGLSVPISIAYHTAGIKNREQASSVGLGWAFNHGGSISRTIMGSDDFGTQGVPYFTSSVPQVAGDMSSTQPAQQHTALSPYYFDFTCSYQANTVLGTEDFTQAFSGGINQYDMEPDIFSYNFPGHSGKFMITRSGQVLLQKQENIQIRYQWSGSTVSFSITDDQGNNFYFNTTETTQAVGGATPISSWDISKIITQQHDSIVFNYVSAPTYTVQGEIDQSDGAYCSLAGPSSTQQQAIIYNGWNLQSIQWSNGQLKFFYDNIRNDMPAGSKLDSVALFSQNPSGGLNYLHSQDFYYSYFNSSYQTSTPLEYLRLRLDSVKQVSTSGSLPPYSFLYNGVLNAEASAKDSFNVDHWGFCNGAGNPTLIPTLNTVYMPPTQYCNQCASSYFTYTGANREANLEYMQNFALQQITYPTGGRSVLTYGANDYDYSKSIAGPTDFPDEQLKTMDTVVQVSTHGTTSGPMNFTLLYPASPPGSGITNLTIKLTFLYQNNNDFTITQLNKVYFNFNGENINLHQDIVGTTCQPGGPACSINFPLGLNIDTVYTWSIYIDPSVNLDTSFSEVHVEFQYQVTQQDLQWMGNNNNISNAGGLRIQSIVNYKDANAPASEQTYTYGYTSNGQQYSYGRLMAIPSYIRYVQTFNMTTAYCTGLYLFSSSNTPLTSVNQGNIVGYDQVTETDVDPLTGKDNGSTVYRYFNSPDTSFSYGGFKIPGTLNMGNSLNGLLLSKAEFADYGGVYQKVSEADNYYHTTNRTVYFSPKYQYVTSNPPSTCTPPGGPVLVETNACFYPSLKSERVLQDSTIDTTFAQQNPAQFVVTKSYSYYDNPLHYQITRSSTTDSKGDTLVTKFKYPQDYIPSGLHVTNNTILDSMIGRNMLDETIEKQDSFYYRGSPSGYITGAQLSLFRVNSSFNTIVPDRTYKLATNSPITNFQPFAINGNSTSLDSRYRQMISFDQYDGYNNLEQYTPIDQDTVTFIWDYNHIYPIAQAKNASLNDVGATSFEADGTGGIYLDNGGTGITNSDAFTGAYSYQINNSLAKFNLNPAKTYIVSLWAKNGTPSYNGYNGGTLVVATSSSWTTGKTINGWTYMEKSMTGITTINVGGGGGLVDEVRFFPANAQMTTYTYNPLVGQTTSCDVDNRATYYFYDAFQRLIRIKDQDGNIIKTYQYHYANQNPYNQ